MNSLSGKTALVTGASRGIGRASALALAQAGAQVLVHYSNGEKEADAVVAQIHKAGGRAEKVGADLRQADGPHLLAKRVRAIVGDRLDILVANAGVSKSASIEDTKVEDFDNLFAVNVRAPYFLVQQLLPTLCKGSNIIFTSSLAAHASVGTLSAYGATKGAVDTLVKHFAAALGPRGIRVNAVAPGVVDTDMSSFAKTEAGREVTLGMQALKRVAQPDDIAPVVAFLASDNARWITGDTVNVDGGAKLWGPSTLLASMTTTTTRSRVPPRPRLDARAAIARLPRGDGDQRTAQSTTTLPADFRAACRSGRWHRGFQFASMHGLTL
jgi:3-oxoacyl-[acyl-carrier protein] reductase